MAEIVQSLFGITPEMYQQSQQARADQQALQYAQLTPFQQANFAIGRGANMLGGAIGRGLGGEDPELTRITMRQQIAGRINPNDPASIKQGIEALAPNDPQGAMMLQREYQRLLESNALVGQRGAAAQASLAQAGREAKQSIPTDIQIANEFATLTDAQDQLLNQPASPERDRAINLITTRLTQLERLTTKEKTQPKTSYGPEADRAAFARFGKNFSDLTQTEAAVIDTLLEERGVKKAKEGASKLVLPGEKALVDIPQFTRNVQQTIEKPLNAIFQVDNALANIGDAIKTDNFASYRAAQTQFAKAIAGAGDLSQKELKAAGADPALVGGAADYLSTLATSTPTRDTMEKMQKAMQTIKRVNTNKANAELERQRKIAKAAGYPQEAVDLALSFPDLTTAPESKKTNTRTLKSGTVVTVIEE
jgi:hypothetical protein